MTKPWYLLLLFFFALLQSVAPLVHAHIDGNQTGLTTSVSMASLHLLGEEGGSSCFFEVGESQSICMADQLPRHDCIGFLSSAIAPMAPNFQHASVVKISPPVVTLAAIVSPYQKPHPQAPPFFC